LTRKDVVEEEIEGLTLEQNISKLIFERKEQITKIKVLISNLNKEKKVNI
jgi:hypothetical protein